MKSYTLRVDSPPRSKGRPRVLPNGRAYTPKSTVKAEKVIADAWEFAGFPKLDGPLSVSIDFDAKGYSITIEEAPHNSTLRADIDNLAKTILDGLNGIAYGDDKQVVHLECWKH